jgi:3-oxoacyl-[acyl-carrier-protein] synthase II
VRRVVVTGCGVASPIGSGMESFFAGLRGARSGIDRVSLFDADSFPTHIAGEVRDLDPSAVPVPQRWRAAFARDRKSSFGLAATREARQNAFGELAPNAVYSARRIGVFVATGLEVFHLEDLVRNYKAGSLEGRRIWEAIEQSPAYACMQIPSDLGVRVIASEWGACGPVVVNVSACAAGAQAIGEAMHAIRDGVVDVAIAGGYDSMINPLGIGGFCMLEAMSKSNELGGGASRPFDAHRDGFVLGEGSGMVVLEEASGALARGARVLVEVAGYGSTLDAYRVSDPAPDQAGAIECLRSALRDAAIEPTSIDYVNAHGTATRKNDPAETAAIRAVFGGHADRLAVSSTKSQMGHLIGAAGAVELLATVFALNEQVLPATINLNRPDPACDLDYVPNAPRPAQVRTVLSNSFGFGGQNAALVVRAFERGES